MICFPDCSTSCEALANEALGELSGRLSVVKSMHEESKNKKFEFIFGKLSTKIKVIIEEQCYIRALRIARSSINKDWTFVNFKEL